MASTDGQRTTRGQLNVTGALSKQDAHYRKYGDEGPPRAGAYKRETNPKETQFRKFYERSDLPVAVGNNVHGCKLMWKVELDKLDYHHYLPLFFEGLRETKDPYASIAYHGALDLLEHGGNRILPCVPQLILPMKDALKTKNPQVMIKTLRALQKLVVSEDMVGEALVPYYRQLLPIMNAYKSKNVNSGDGIYYGQRRQENIGDLIQETLELLEVHGGDDAFINVKYMVPTYESVVLN